MPDEADQPRGECDARALAERAARVSYGKLLAVLASRTRDIAAAEDALGDAFAAALARWPETGAPAAPEAWLLTAARRRLIDAARRNDTRRRAMPEIEAAMAELAGREETDGFADERLKLLFVCSHEAIDERIRTPLMLQTVLGLDAAAIARVFVTEPAAMGQRLVRAKRKIAETGIPFAPPDPAAAGPKLGAVTDAIYAAFTAGYDAAETGGGDFAEEAIFLGGLLARLAPDCAEAHGALALMLHVHARRDARRLKGVYVPFTEQDADHWDRAMIGAAETALCKAAALAAPGRYQIEAAIQSAHVAARLRDVDTRRDIVLLYDQLLAIAPTTGARVAKAAALIGLDDVAGALALLEAVDEPHRARYQPYWATRACALELAGDRDGAGAAYARAIALARDPAVRRYLIARRARFEAL